MREIKRVGVPEISENENQPRKHFDEAELLALGQNMKAHGQQIPVIVYPVDVLVADKGAAKYIIADGERRWRAAQLVGITELDAIILPSEPPAAELLLTRANIDVHRVALSPMERSNLLTRIQKENGWSVTQLAAAVHIKQPVVSKLLAFQKLDGEVQKLVHSGQVDSERAFIISQEPDAAKQLAMAKSGASREELRKRVRSPGKPEVKAPAARFALPGGMLVSLHGNDLTLTTAIEVFQELVRMLRKSVGQHHDIVSIQRAMKNQLKART